MSFTTPLSTPPAVLVTRGSAAGYYHVQGAAASAQGSSPPHASRDGAVTPQGSRPSLLESTRHTPSQRHQQLGTAPSASSSSSLAVSPATSTRAGRRSVPAPATTATSGSSSLSSSSSSSDSYAGDSQNASFASSASLMAAPTGGSRRRHHTLPPPPSSPPAPPPPALPHSRMSAAGAPPSPPNPPPPVSRALMTLRDSAEVTSYGGGAAAAFEAVPLPTLVEQQRDRIYALVQERDVARAELQELHELFQRLHDDYDTATKEAAAEQLRLFSLRGEHDAQSEEMRLLRASHARQQQRIEAFEAEWLQHSKHLRDQLDAVTQERDTVLAQRDACMSDGTDLRRQLLQLQAEVHRSDAAHRDALRVQAEAHAQELRTALQEREAQLHTRAEATRREARLVQQGLQELDAGHNAASEEREALRWRLAETEAVVGKKELLRAELEQTVQQLRARLSKTEETARQDARRQAERAEEMERLYRNQVSNEQQRAQTLLDDLASARKATQEALRQHEALQQRHSEESSEAALRSAKQEEAWRQQLHSLRAELEDAQSRALRHEATAQRRQRELEAFTATSQGFQESHERLQQAHTMQAQQLSRAEGSVRVLQSQLREKEREAELLRCAMEQATWTREMRQAAQHTLASLLGVPRVSVVGRGGLGIRARRVQRAVAGSNSSDDDDEEDGNTMAAPAAIELVDQDRNIPGREDGGLHQRVAAAAGPALQLEWAAAPSHPAAASGKAKPSRATSAAPRRADAPGPAATTTVSSPRRSAAPPPSSSPQKREAPAVDTARAAAAGGGDDPTSPPRRSATLTTASAEAEAHARRAETIDRTAPRNSSAGERDGEAEERQRWAAATPAAASNHPFLHRQPYAAQSSAAQATPAPAPSPTAAAAPPLHPGTPRVMAPLHHSSVFTQQPSSSPLRTLAYTPISGGGGPAALSAATTLNTTDTPAAAAAGGGGGAFTSPAGAQSTPGRAGSPRLFTSPLRARPSSTHAYNIPDPRDDGTLPRDGLFASASAAAAAAAVGNGLLPSVAGATTGSATHPWGTASAGHLDVFFDDFLGPSPARRAMTPARHDARTDSHQHGVLTSASAAPGTGNHTSRPSVSQPPTGHGRGPVRVTEDSASAVSSTPRFVLRPHAPVAPAPGVRAAQLLATLADNAPHDSSSRSRSRSRSRNSVNYATGIGRTSEDAAMQQYLHDMVQQVLANSSGSGSGSGSGVGVADRAHAGGAPAGNSTADLDDDFSSASRPRSVQAVPVERTASSTYPLTHDITHHRARGPLAEAPSTATHNAARARRATAVAQPAAHQLPGSTNTISNRGDRSDGGGIAGTLRQLAERQHQLLHSLSFPQPDGALSTQLQHLVQGDAGRDVGSAYDNAASQAMIAASLAAQTAPASESARSVSRTTATDLAVSVPVRQREEAVGDDAAHVPRDYADERRQRGEEAADVDLDPRQLSYSTSVTTAATRHSVMAASVQRGTRNSAAAAAAEVAALAMSSTGDGEVGGRACGGGESARAQHGTVVQRQHSASQDAWSTRDRHTPSDVHSTQSAPSVSAVSSLTQLGRRLAVPFA